MVVIQCHLTNCGIKRVFHSFYTIIGGYCVGCVVTGLDLPDVVPLVSAYRLLALQSGCVSRPVKVSRNCAPRFSEFSRVQFKKKNTCAVSSV